MNLRILAKNVATSITLLERDLLLLMKTPKDYLYSYTYSATEKVKIEEYDPRVKALGEELVAQMKTKVPKSRIHFIGSAAMEIPGQRDIDLFIECKPKDFHLYLPDLITIFGQPKKQKKSFVEWETEQENCHIDLVMCDASNYILKRPVEIFEVLMHNRQYLDEYREIKLRSNQLSVREYKKRRMVFFNKLRVQ